MKIYTYLIKFAFYITFSKVLLIFNNFSHICVTFHVNSVKIYLFLMKFHPYFRYIFTNLIKILQFFTRLYHILHWFCENLHILIKFYPFLLFSHNFLQNSAIFLTCSKNAKIIWSNFMDVLSIFENFWAIFNEISYFFQNLKNFNNTLNYFKKLICLIRSLKITSTIFLAFQRFFNEIFE